VFVATVETQSNQSYIYASNRQAAALGASQLLLEACTTWVLEACGLQGDDLTSVSKRRELLDKQGNPQQSESKPYVVIATSGRAVLLSNERSVLEEVVYTVSKRALCDAPGMGITAGIKEFDWDESRPPDKSASLWDAMRDASVISRQNWAYATHPETRFGRLPIMRDCSLSSYPANHRERTADDVTEFRSAIVARQIDARDRALRRIRGALGEGEKEQRTIADEIDDLESSWHAVVHADSNGFGTLFRVLGQVLPGDNLNCLNRYRKFSLDLEQVTTEALAESIRNLSKERCVYPIVFGGDDVTLIVRADAAVDLSKGYLVAFAENASSVLGKLDVRDGCQELLPPTLSASAGIAFTKSRYPFWAAYELADDLTSAAKTTYRKLESHQAKPSSVDFHVLYDSTDTSLDSIRQRRRGVGNRRLHGGPYIVPTNSGSDLKDSPTLDEVVDAAKDLREQRPVLRDLRGALGTEPERVESILRNAEAIRRVTKEDADYISKLTDDNASRLPDVLDLMEMLGPPTAAATREPHDD
jgi:hypothetical protein